MIGTESWLPGVYLHASSDSLEEIWFRKPRHSNPMDLGLHRLAASTPMNLTGHEMTENWIDVSAQEALTDGEVIEVDAGGMSLALYKVDGNLFVTDNMCTHGNAPLCDGWLDGFEIECPMHQGRFDIRTGKAMCAPLVEDVRIYPLKIENGRVFIELNQA